ncbi:MAG: hypothetical protein JNL04_16070 [Rhodospirillaceae bacterium]|nr:hypothetical protein [Rhodospirillaceae bacterium]
MTITPSLFLRRALLADAVASAGTGVLMAFGAGLLTSLLGLPEMLLREAGIFLLPYAAFVGWMGTRARLPEGLVWLVIVGNALWTVASIALFVWTQPTALGYAFVLGQAVAVGVFAELQYMGLKRPIEATA